MSHDEPPDPRPEVMRLAGLTEALDAMNGTKRFFLHRVGRRGAALLFFGLLDAVYSFSLLSPIPDYLINPSLRYLMEIAPLWVCGTAWGVAALFCFVNAFRVDDMSGFAAAIAIKVGWGLLYIGAIFDGVPRSYVSGAIWLCLGAFVGIIASWPEPTAIPVSPQRQLDRLSADLARLSKELDESRQDLNRQQQNRHRAPPAESGE